MSDSPRWHLDGLPGTTGIVEVMLYADHVAAVAVARIEWSMTNGPAFDFARGQSVGFEAGVKAARDAVDAVWSAPDGLLRGLCNHADALAAIDALRGES